MDRSFAYDSGWTKSLERLEVFEQRQVAEARDQYLADPSYPGLKFEKLQGVGNRLRTIRASEELRVLLACEGSVTVFLRAGHHDPVYRLAPRVRYVVPRVGDAGLYPVGKTSDLDGAPLEAPRRRPGAAASVSEGIVDHWEHRDLRDYGFSDDDIDYLRTVTVDGLDEVAPQRCDVVERAIEITEIDPYDWRLQVLVDDEEARAERFRTALANSGAVTGLSPWLSTEELDRLMGAPIEEPPLRACGSGRSIGPRGSNSNSCSFSPCQLRTIRASRSGDGTRPTTSTPSGWTSTSPGCSWQ